MAPKARVPELGPVEFAILRILWRNPRATAGEVQNEYNRRRSHPLAYTTVMTLLTRLVEKGVVSAERDRQPFRFSARVGREALLQQRVREFVDVFFDGSAADLALRLVEDGPLPEEAVRRLEELLREQRPIRPARRTGKGGP